MVPSILDSGSPLCIGIHPTSIPWNIGIKGKLPLNKVYNGWTIYKNMPSFQVNISSATVHTMTTQYTHLGVTTCLYTFYIYCLQNQRKRPYSCFLLSPSHFHIAEIRSYKSVHQIKCLKGARSYFSKSSFLFHLKNHHSKDVYFKFQLKRLNRLDVRSNFVYCSCLYLTV